MTNHMLDLIKHEKEVEAAKEIAMADSTPNDELRELVEEWRHRDKHPAYHQAADELEELINE